MKVTDNLYAYIWTGNDNNCNTYLFASVLNGNKHILIDPGHIVTPYLREPAYDRLLKAIREDGLNTEDIGLVFITHAHPDHFEASVKFRDTTQAKVALHKDDADVFKMFGGSQIDVYLQEGELKVDELVREKLEVYHTPGHSSGEVSLYWPAKKALAVGDVIFYQNTGRVDLPGGDPGKLKNSINRLSELDVEYLLCGHPYGHPGLIKGREEVRRNFEFLKKYIWF